MSVLQRPLRRNLARKHLKPNEIPITFTSFPRLGVPGVFTDPPCDPADATSSHSLFLPEEITNPHARFPSVVFRLSVICVWRCQSHVWPTSYLPRTLTANIRMRRGSKVAINLPLFIDERTPRPFVDPTIPWQRDTYPEDPGMSRCPSSFMLLLMATRAFRGKKWCCYERSYIHGRYGIRHGLLLSTTDLPILQRSRCKANVRRPDSSWTYHGEHPVASYFRHHPMT